ncbi:MAG: hypothetical protein KF836_10770 [Fimbriimonadaceae bacterium]|nr:hypothetical protein [Fimbriimonadaceae bacterium]
MKGFLAVVAGYLTMAIIVFALLTVAYLALGVDGAFMPGTYEVSMPWIIIMLIVGIGAAWLGGWVCRKISDNTNTVKILAGVFFFLAGLSAIWSFTMVIHTDLRPADVSAMDAMAKAITPKWVTMTNVVIGTVGVLIGGKALGK